MNVNEVAATLHVSAREVVRMADSGILPAIKVKDAWQFRAGEIWNWIEKNLHSLPERRRKDRHPVGPTDLLIAPTLTEQAIALDLPAKTKSSLLRELAALAEAADPFVDAGALAAALIEREQQGSTALQDGVAIPHPAGNIYSQGPVIAAARTARDIPFGERGGGLTDLFFLVCCADRKDHLLYLGRLCRLLIDKDLQAELRAAATPADFLSALSRAEESLCEQQGSRG